MTKTPRTHHPSRRPGHAHCGVKTRDFSTYVSCVNCVAALAADKEAAELREKNR